MKNIYLFLVAVTLMAINYKTQAQAYNTSDFVGNWEGRITSESFGGYDDPIILTIEEDGFYTETSGHLMPDIYPNTQESEYDAETNRYHFWYLGTVWGGQYFYDHFFYEVVYFQNDTLEMHYNYWDDPEPYPEVGTIKVVRQGFVGIEEDIVNSEVNDRYLLKVVDITGREVSADSKGQLLIYLYSDGTTEKRFVNE
jgi:hypothetical protein